MISLFTLYNILESTKHDYNENFGGYYLGHNLNKVIFGYLYPLDKNQLSFTNHFPLNEAKEINKNNDTLYHIPTLKEISFIQNSNVYDSYYKYWNCWILNKGKFINYDFYTKHAEYSNQNHRVILVRNIKILK